MFLLNLHALRLFSKVAEYKSVSKAAEDLRISQPAVTIQIRNLEKELGLTLIESKGRGIKLTNSGEFLYLQSQRLFDLERDIEAKVAELKNTGVEKLNIVASYLSADILLPKWISRYLQKNPSIRLHVKTENSNRVIEELLHYKGDIAIVIHEDSHHPDVNYTFLCDLDFWFIVPYGHRLAEKTVPLAELMKETFVLKEEGSSTKELLWALCKLHQAPPPKVGVQMNGLHESIQTVAEGYGIMLAPAIALTDYLNRKQVARVFVKEVEIKRQAYYCTRKFEKEPLPHVSEFIDSLPTSIN